MARRSVQTTIPYTSFVGGEISPDLYGRTDLPTYVASLKQSRNFLALPQGILIRRPGTRFAGEGLESPLASRVIGFEHPAGNYILEFGNFRMRIFRQSTGQAITENGVPYVLETPYSLAQAFEMGYARSVDTFYTAHHDVPPKRLIRTDTPLEGNASEMAWEWEDQPFIDGPYEEQNQDPNYVVNVSAKSGENVTVIAGEAVTGQYYFEWRNVNRLFSNDDVGKYLRIKNRVKDDPSSIAWWGYGVIRSVFEGGTSCVIDIIEPFSASGLGTETSSTEWRVGSWVARPDLREDEGLGPSPSGYPEVVSFVEGRLCYANSPNEPDRVHLSEPGRPYQRFSPSGLGEEEGPTVTDKNAIDITITGSRERQSEVKWVESGRVPYIGTSGGVYPFLSQGETGLTPTNVEVRFANSASASRVPPVVIDSNPVYASLSARKLRVVGYDLGSDGYRVPEISKRAQHITSRGIRETIYQQEPHQVVWIVLEDGTLASLVYDSTENVVSWAPHSVTNDAEVRDGAIVQREDGAYDETWFMVERQIQGQPRAYLEILSAFNAERDGAEHAFYVDSGVTHEGGVVSEVTGLSHLEGEEVAILADGAVMPPQVVTGGKVKLPKEASVVQVGLRYTSLAETLPQELPLVGGTAMGKRSRATHLYARVQNTAGGEYSMDGERYYGFYPRPVVSQMDHPPPLRNEIKRWPAGGGWDSDTTVFIRQEDPVAFNLALLVPDLATGER